MMVIYFLVITFFHSSSAEAFERCPKSSPTPNSTVHFVNKHDLVPGVQGCINYYLSFRCCMANYKEVRWFQLRNGIWVDFLYQALPEVRDLGEDDNQTAILMRPLDHGYDNGSYRCIGYGAVPGDSINHTIVVNLMQCPDIRNSAPNPFLPETEPTSKETNISTNVTVMCGAIFGLYCDGTHQCTTQWVKLEQPQESIPEGNANASLRVYYINSGSASCIHDFTSTLYIFNFDEGDYGTYVCLMKNYLGNATRTFKLIALESLEDDRVRNVVIGAACVAVVAVIVGASCYRRKWDICIRYNEIVQVFGTQHGRQMEHDVLLLHTSSVTIDKSFARHCCTRLQEHNYDAIIEDDITGGRDTISEWLRRAELSHTVLVILSPNFFTDEDQIFRLSLQNIIRSKARIVFVIFQMTLQRNTCVCSVQLNSTTNDRHLELSRDLEAAVRIKPKVCWTVSVDDQAPVDWKEVERAHLSEVKDFWRQLLAYLPLQPRNVVDSVS